MHEYLHIWTNPTTCPMTPTPKALQYIPTTFVVCRDLLCSFVSSRGLTGRWQQEGNKHLEFIFTWFTVEREAAIASLNNYSILPTCHSDLLETIHLHLFPLHVHFPALCSPLPRQTGMFGVGRGSTGSWGMFHSASEAPGGNRGWNWVTVYLISWVM